MSYEVLPGCHGTGDGNLFDHYGKPIPNLGDVSGVQDLVLRRWIDFADLPLRQIKLDLKHPALDAVAFQYLSADKKNRDEQLLQNYMAILQHSAAYKYLSTTNYQVLGQRSLVRDVYYNSSRCTPVTSLDVERDDTFFVNQHHVQLAMEKELSTFDFFQRSITEQVNWINDNIKQAFADQDKASDLLSRLINTEKNLPLLQNSLSSLINTVAQKYLRNHLTEKEQLDIRSCVIETFTVLDQSTKPVAKKVKLVIQQGLTATLIQHQNALFSTTGQLLDEYETLLTRLFDNNSHEARDKGLLWLLQAEQKLEELKLLAMQLQELHLACDPNLLAQTWKKILPDYLSPPAESKAENIALFELNRALHYISQQQKLVVQASIEVLSKLPEALGKRPDSMKEEFYQLIHPQANESNLRQEFFRLQQRNEHQVQELKTQQLQIEALQRINQQQSKELKAQQDIIRQNKDRITNLETFLTEEEEKLIVKIAARVQCCQRYLKHLNKTNDKTPLHAMKKQKILELIDLMKNPTILPSLRLRDSEVILLQSKELLKQHRDPMWQRFIRDFFRITARIFSGYGFYQCATQEGPHFFKSSHGEQFIDSMAELNRPGI